MHPEIFCEARIHQNIFLKKSISFLYFLLSWLTFSFHYLLTVSGKDQNMQLEETTVCLKRNKQCWRWDFYYCPPEVWGLTFYNTGVRSVFFLYYFWIKIVEQKKLLLLCLDGGRINHLMKNVFTGCICNCYI